MKQKAFGFIKTILKSIRKHIFLSLTIITIFLLSLFGPLIVKLIISNNTIITLFSKVWAASDALNYYSAIVAAIIGVLGIYITIWYSNKKYRDDIRNQILPFFAFHVLMKNVKYPDNWLFQMPFEQDKHNENSDWSYSEYKLRNVYFNLDNDGIECTGRLEDKKMELVKKDGYYIETNDNGAKLLLQAPFLMIPYEIENVGKGPAINTRIGFNKLSTPKEKRKYIKPECIKIGDSFSIHVFCDNVKDNNITGKYILEIYYSDIYNNNYCQEYKIQIEKNDLIRSLVTTDCETIQKRIY